MKYLIIVLLLIGCNSKQKIIRVIDGDSYILSDGTRIRLFDADSPEIGQPFGYEAKIYAQDWLLNREVFIEKKGHDKYGRTLVNIRFKEQGSTWNNVMVARGLAVIYPRYCKDKQLLSSAEYAKSLKIGLYSNPSYITPQSFRKLKN